MADDQFLSFEDALDKLKLQEEELKRLVSEGEIRAFREGDTMKLRAQDVDDLRGELSGDAMDVGDSKEIVFEDDVDVMDEAGMATEEITDVETILQEDDEVEEIDLEDEVIEEAVPARRASARAAVVVEEEAHESAAVKAFLVLTSFVMILGVPVAMAFSNNQISSLARAVAGMFDFDKVMPN
ncbi:MAG: hypothetical protein OSB14_08810 [Planctomycetota bacterium]|nr:hypothetical protein [Planctomycetota bacterium]